MTGDRQEDRGRSGHGTEKGGDRRTRDTGPKTEDRGRPGDGDGDGDGVGEGEGEGDWDGEGTPTQTLEQGLGGLSTLHP